MKGKGEARLAPRSPALRPPASEPAGTLADVLVAASHRLPMGLAYKFLLDGETDGQAITYGELDRRARCVAAALTRAQAAAGRVVLALPPGIDFAVALWGCFYAGAVPVPVPVPKTERALESLRDICADAEPSAILSEEDLLRASRRSACVWMSLRQCLEADPMAPTRRQTDDLAMLQYTSGSTADPRGVMLSHGNLLANLEQIRVEFGHTEQSSGVIWLPPYHDMGLVGGLLEPVYVGMPVTLLSPSAFIKRPRRWLEAISRSRATTSGAPNFAYEECVRRIPADERLGLDLSTWNVAFVGAEVIRSETLERFAEAFGPCGFLPSAFRPCYGLAESTLMVTATSIARGPRVMEIDASALEQGRVESRRPGERFRALVGNGRIGPQQSLLVANPRTGRRCSSDEVGEIWIKGPSVAQGYWRRPELTRSVFGGFEMEHGDGPFVRTGDLGFVSNAELFITGRLKELIVVRGRNHDPQDIELTVARSHPSLRGGRAAVFSIPGAQDEQVVVVQEVSSRAEIAVADVSAAIRRSVAAEHGISIARVVLTRMGSVPRTTSGKVQRLACRRLFLNARLPSLERDHVGPRELEPPRSDVVECALATMLAEILNRETVGVRDSFFELGGDSLKAARLGARVSEEFGLDVSMATLMEHPTVADLARYVIQKDRTPGEGVTRARIYLELRAMSADQVLELLAADGTRGVSGGRRRG